MTQEYDGARYANDMLLVYEQRQRVGNIDEREYPVEKSAYYESVNTLKDQLLDPTIRGENLEFMRIIGQDPMIDSPAILAQAALHKTRSSVMTQAFKTTMHRTPRLFAAEYDLEQGLVLSTEAFMYASAAKSDNLPKLIAMNLRSNGIIDLNEQRRETLDLAGFGNKMGDLLRQNPSGNSIFHELSRRVITDEKIPTEIEPYINRKLLVQGIEVNRQFQQAVLPLASEAMRFK